MHSICFEQAFHTAHFYYILSSCLVYSNYTDYAVSSHFSPNAMSNVTHDMRSRSSCLVTDQVILTELVLWHILFDMFVSLI